MIISSAECSLVVIKQEVACALQSIASANCQMEPERIENRQEGISYLMDETESLFNYKKEYKKKMTYGDKKARDGAMALLNSWLTAHGNAAEEDLKKIWKGLFYCLSHAKRQSVQACLIKKFVTVLQNVNPNLCQHYFKAFLLVLTQEWSGMSNLQSEKFSLLLKQLLHHMFIVLNNSGWDPQLTKGFVKDLTDETFLHIDNNVNQKMNFYIVDVYVSKLLEFMPLQVETFVLLMEPFFSVLAKASQESLVWKIKTTVFDHLLENGRNLIYLKQEGKYIEEKMQNLGSIVLMMGATTRLFKLATATTTLQANKRVLSELYQEFTELDRILVSSEVSYHSPEANKTKINNNLFSEKALKVSHFSSQGSQNPSKGKPKKIKKASITKITPQGSQSGLTNLGEKARPRKAKKASITEKKAESSQAKVKLREKGKPRKAKKVSITKIIVESTQSGVTKLGEKQTSSSPTKVLNGLYDGRSREKSAMKEGSDLHNRQLQSKQPEKLVEEVALSNTGIVQEAESRGEFLNFGSQENKMLDDTLVSNLKVQFEEVELELEDCISPLPSLVLSASPLSSVSLKRKRMTGAWKVTTPNPISLDDKENDDSASAVLCTATSVSKMSSGKSVKKVTFALKNNLIWMPSTPLPAHSLRVPPSATPRGSALKRGVPPGPISITKQSPSAKHIVSRRSQRTQFLWMER